MFFIRIAIGVNFAAIYLFLNNSVTFDKLGSFNGLSMSLTSAVRYMSEYVSKQAMNTIVIIEYNLF